MIVVIYHEGLSFGISYNNDTHVGLHTHNQCLQEPLSLWFGVKHADVSCQSCVSIEIQSAALLGYEFSPDDCTDYRFNEEVGNPVMTGSLIVCP